MGSDAPSFRPPSVGGGRLRHAAGPVPRAFPARADTKGSDSRMNPGGMAPSRPEGHKSLRRTPAEAPLAGGFGARIHWRMIRFFSE